jgi:MTH538 TIR-like domain (DUF1863)
MPLYDAFISYSHVKDKPIATALQSAIQKLGKPWYRRRALRVFRDDTSLSATPYLWPTIENALGQSHYFLLLASPEAAASKWVNKEVSYWVEHNSIDTLLIGLTDGEIAWDDALGDFVARGPTPLPPALTKRFPSEPKWVDLRPYRAGSRGAVTDAKFTELTADFAAAIHGVQKEDLLSQEVRQQRTALALAWSASSLLLTLTVVATALFFLAYTADQKANANYDAAKSAADSLVHSIASELRKQKGVTTRTLDIAFDSVDQLIHNIQQVVKQQDNFPTSELRYLFGKVETVLVGAAARPDEMTALELSRATLLYEFAETYHQSANDIDAARRKALDSLKIREDIRKQMLRQGVDTSDLEAKIAVTEEEIGDLSRKELEQKNDASPNYASARKPYEEALGLLEPLVKRFPDRVDFVREYGHILTRLGDLDVKAGDRDSAEQRYAILLDVTLEVFRRKPDVDAMRELGWGFRKLGEFQSDPFAATAKFVNEVCVRRQLVTLQPNSNLFARDLAYALTRLGAAKLRLQPPDQEGAEDAYFEGLHLRLQAVKENFEPQTVAEFADGLNRVSEIYRARHDATQSDYYSTAAADVKKGQEEAFPYRLPDDYNAARAAQLLADERRSRGALAMIKAPTIQLEYADHEFEVVRLGEIERASEGCWDVLAARIRLGESPTAKIP